ncbi:MAG: PHP domain-containing protein [Thermoleophilia bacterium]|nr:PHP domain-containing protein [Thermoleophilia bacterium]
MTTEQRLQRIALVTPYAWSSPHPVNDHIAELATGLCERAQAGEPTPEVVVIAPTLDPRARRTTRRALHAIARGDDVAGVLLADDLLAAQPGEGRRTENTLEFPLLALGFSLGQANVSLRASLRLLMQRGDFDLVHVHDPLASGLTRYVVRHWPGLTVATFHERPAAGLLDSLASGMRERLLEQLDLTLVPGTHVVEQLAAVGIELTEPQTIATIAEMPPRMRSRRISDQRTTLVAGRGTEDDAVMRAAIKSLEPLAATDERAEITLMSRWEPHHRPRETKAWRGRLHNSHVATRDEADDLLSSATAYLWFSGTHVRGVLEARAAGVPVVCVTDGSFEGLSAQIGALGKGWTERVGTPGNSVDAAAAAAVESAEQQAEARGLELSAEMQTDIDQRLAAPAASRVELASDHEDIWNHLAGRRQVHIPSPKVSQKTCVIDLHMHTSHSWDCATDPEALLYVAKKIGLTAVAITDHNEIYGALACAELAEEYGIQVIVGEEVKTAEGEVIGLFLSEKIEGGLSWDETIRQIKAQDGLVYVPHPFDRLHTIPSAQCLRDSIDEIDAFEVYNARLAFQQYNRDAQRFARKYNLIEGAGSDAHVPQGLGTGAVHMPAWDDRENFLTSLAQGQILRRPKNLLYIQGLKWINDLSGKSKHSPAESGDEHELPAED